MIGMHPDLIRIIQTTAERLPFEIMIPSDGGLRTEAMQAALVKKGASTIMNSRHRTGHAVDLCALVDGRDVWTDPYARTIAQMMQAVAAEQNVNLTWGGDWKSGDTPHFELTRKDHPEQDTSWHNDPVDIVVASKEIKKSRKHRAAGWAKWGAGISGGVTAGWPAIKQQITIGQDIVATATQVLAANSLIVVSGLCIVAAITFNWMQIMQKEDLEQGRYTPSGANQ